MQPTSEQGTGAHAGSQRRRGDVAQGPSRHRSFSVFLSRAHVCECADGCVGVCGLHLVVRCGLTAPCRVDFDLPNSQNVYV